MQKQEFKEKARFNLDKASTMIGELELKMPTPLIIVDTDH